MSNSRRLRRAVGKGQPAPAEPQGEWWDQARERVGRENVYSCETCGGHIVTVDRDPGVTPMFLGCRATDGCTGRMHSNGYPDPATKPAHIGPATWEWFRPASTKGMSAGMRQHVEQGGLELREIATQRDPQAAP